MSRPRKTARDPSGNALLPRMYWKHGAYYLVDAAAKWHRLGTEYVESVKVYGVRIASDRYDSMGALLKAWKTDQLPPYAEATRINYERMCGQFDEAFQDFSVSDMTPADVYRFCAQWKTKPRSANAYRSLLSLILTYGASTEWPNDNPAKQSMTFKPGKKRDRYLTDEEVKRVYEGARVAKDGLKNRSGEIICCMIDLAYETGQRIGDLINLRYSEVGEEGIFFFPGKTRNNTAVKLLVTWTPELRDVIERTRAYGKVKGLHVLRRLDGKPFTYSGVQSAWKRACARVGIEDAHIHDLKAKSLTDTEDESEAQKRGGHATPAQTAHYRKARLVTKVKPVSAR